MNRREWIVGGVCGSLSLCAGVAVSPKGKLAGKPLEAFDRFFSDFCVDEDNNQRVVTAYYSNIDVDKWQAILMEGKKVIGIEYIISNTLYNLLPRKEKEYWHSHIYQVESGLMTLIDADTQVEYAWVHRMKNTWGKTYLFWNGELPVGEPVLQLSFSKDDQVNQTLVEKRDSEHKINTVNKQRKRTHKRIRSDSSNSYRSR